MTRQTLVFPDPLPRPEIVRGLLLFFTTVTSYQAVENASPNQGPDLEPDQWKPIVPYPLGDKTAAFTHLMRDIIRHREEYRTGLLFAMANERPEEVPSVRRLARQIAGVGDDSPGGHGAREARLVQALLLLKLAEVRAREEAEIEENLRQIEDKNRRLLAALHDETDAPTSFPSSPPETQPPSPDLHVAAAWSLLNQHDLQATTHGMLTITVPELARSLLERHERRSGQPPEILGSLPIPDLSPYREERGRTLLCTELDRFRQDLSAELETARILLADAGADMETEKIQEGWHDIATAWKKAINCFTKARPPALDLHFARLGHGSPQDLLASIFLPGDPAPLRSAPAGRTVLAFLAETGMVRG